MGIIGWLVMAGLCAGFAYACIISISNPGFISCFPIIAAVSWALGVVEKRRQQRVAAERREESICSFARSFNCRATDTWIVRAVFEEAGAYVRFPIRPEDRLEEDLKIDSEDIDYLAEVIALRTGRPLEECEKNPLCGKVKTVGELVEFFVYQQRRSRPAA